MSKDRACGRSEFIQAAAPGVTLAPSGPACPRLNGRRPDVNERADKDQVRRYQHLSGKRITGSNPPP